jgi:hypothetical protein
MTVNTVGLDLAKDVFQVHGISADLLAYTRTLPVK